MKGTLTVGELKKIIKDGRFSNDTPIVIQLHRAGGETIGLQIDQGATVLSNEAIILQPNPYKTTEYRDL